MDERNPHALALAFRRAQGKSLKIKELGLGPDTQEAEKLATIQALCEKKALLDASDWKIHAKGQTWYVEDLIEFSKLKPAEKLDLEYKAAFPDTASEAEMIAALEAI